VIGVRFVKAWGVYNPGEVAGFDPDAAAFLIGHGAAVKIGAADKGTVAIVPLVDAPAEPGAATVDAVPQTPVSGVEPNTFPRVTRGRRGPQRRSQGSQQ